MWHCQVFYPSHIYLLGNHTKLQLKIEYKTIKSYTLDLKCSYVQGDLWLDQMVFFQKKKKEYI